ncbi:FUSC family protein [Robertkochia solimangrovi]|uniref:FUSC family protein n=1 Tax=Robertkochia solimangrovi TaxID=2213046 RepID=UPI0013A5767A|nr:FUSC family protein [Robertkochia solimangrovi]
MLNKLNHLIKSYNFSKGLLTTSAIFIAIGFCYYFFDVGVASSVGFGVLITSFSDIPGSRRDHLFGMIIAMFLGATNSILIHFFKDTIYLLYPVMAILLFCNAMIAVYGFRASLVSFGGLLAICVSFAHHRSGSDIFMHALYMLCGGVWYLLLSQVFNKLRSKAYIEELLKDCMSLTAEYLEKKANRITGDGDREGLHEIFELENTINEKHENIRDHLLHFRQHSGTMNLKRQQLLIFIKLVDILELSIANPLKVADSDRGNPAYLAMTDCFISTLTSIAENLREIATAYPDSAMQPEHDYEGDMEKLKESINEYRNSIDVVSTPDLVINFRNLYDFVEKLYLEIMAIERIIGETGKKKAEISDVIEHQKFIPQHNYDLKILIENLNANSPVFKHSLRLVITMLAGYTVGHIFDIPNAYWILLTIFVIMRPGYVLTKVRFRERIIGTLIGALLAFPILLLTGNTLVLILLTFISLVLGLTFTQHNYKAAAAFITISIIFIYSLLTPDSMAVIQYRVMDTLIGGGLAWLSNILLWPNWEKYNMHYLLLDSIRKISGYLESVQISYQLKTRPDTAYKLSRKNAFIAITNLLAAFQRMTQEPKSQQSGMQFLYEVCVVIHTVLSSTAAVGAFIQNHPTTECSVYVNNYFNAILRNLQLSIQLLEGKIEGTEMNDESAAVTGQEFLNQYLNDLKSERLQQIATGVARSNEDKARLKEAKLISDQLEWLYDLSRNLYHGLENYLQKEAAIRDQIYTMPRP